jgi:acetyltransferase-like isoleucine patch superfamily enzyme
MAFLEMLHGRTTATFATVEDSLTTLKQVSDRAKIGEGTKIWHWSQIREGATIGKNCIIAKSVYIDMDVRIGDNVKIQNNVSVYRGVAIEDGVFVGPHVVLANDKKPRAINPNGTLKKETDWNVAQILIRYGASIGANATVLPGVTIGEFAMVGAASLVSSDVPPFALAYGNPARVVGKVDQKGNKIDSFPHERSPLLSPDRPFAPSISILICNSFSIDSDNSSSTVFCFRHLLWLSSRSNLVKSARNFLCSCILRESNNEKL